MRKMINSECYKIAGGQIGSDIDAHVSPCSNAVINFLKYRANALGALLDQNTSSKAAAVNLMIYHQKIAMQECSYDDLHNSGCVDPSIFLY